MGSLGAGTLIQASYFIAAALFILGLKRMSSPVTARGGIVWAGVGMVVATLITFLTPGMENYGLMTVAIAIGGILAWVTGRRVAMPSRSSAVNSASVPGPARKRQFRPMISSRAYRVKSTKA